MRWFLVVVLLVAGCGGGGSYVCRMDAFFHGDQNLKDVFEQYKLKALPTPFDGQRFHSGVGTEDMIADQLSPAPQNDSVEWAMSITDPPPGDGVDIVILNAGRLDIENSGGPHPVEAYQDNLRLVLAWYQNWFANQGKHENIVFALTLRYRDGNQRNNRVDEYNVAAKSVCDEIGVVTFDPNDIIDLLTWEDDEHLDDVGNLLLSEYLNTFISIEYVCVPF